MARKRNEKPATQFTTRGGTVVMASRPDAPVALDALPKAVLDGIMAGYQIATYCQRDRAAWKAALEKMDLDGDARIAAADYLRDRWNSTPYNPDDFIPAEPYGKGAPVKMVFATRE